MHAVITSFCPAYSRRARARTHTHTHTHLFTDMQSYAHAQVARIPGVKNLVVMGSQALTGTKPVWYSIDIVYAAYVTCPENMAPLLPPTTIETQGLADSPAGILQVYSGGAARPSEGQGRRRHQTAQGYDQGHQEGRNVKKTQCFGAGRCCLPFLKQHYSATLMHRWPVARVRGEGGLERSASHERRAALAAV